MRVRPVLRKTPVLKRPAFGCLREIPAVNVTRGCLHRCVYCYARCFPETPTNEVLLYENLPALLSAELARRKRRGKLPQAVAFSTASDLFQPHEAILRTTYEALRLLLEGGVPVSFLTKGRLTREFWELFAAHAPLVQARFGLVSLDLGYQRLFEPWSATPFLRLRQIEKAAALGLSPAVRIDPVIPGITDREESLSSLLRHIAHSGAEEVAVSYLVLRPGVAQQMRRTLPPDLWGTICQAYRDQPWVRVITSATTKLVRPEIRQRGYALFREIGSAYGLKVRLCGCKNPDLPFESCAPWSLTRGKSSPQPRQLDLFGEIPG